MDKHTELKPCPFCGYKNAKISERRNRINGGHYCDDDYCMEVVIKISANVMCNCCHAKGGTAVGFIESDLFPPSDRMKRTFNVEPITAIWERAENKWNRRAADDEI